MTTRRFTALAVEQDRFEFRCVDRGEKWFVKSRLVPEDEYHSERIEVTTYDGKEKTGYSYDTLGGFSPMAQSYASRELSQALRDPSFYGLCEDLARMNATQVREFFETDFITIVLEKIKKHDWPNVTHSQKELFATKKRDIYSYTFVVKETDSDFLLTYTTREAEVPDDIFSQSRDILRVSVSLPRAKGSEIISVASLYASQVFILCLVEMFSRWG